MYAELIPSRTIKIVDTEYLYFGGTAYLGMHANPAFGTLVMDGINHYGTNYGASRLGASIPVFDEMESKLSFWLRAPSSILLSSGTLAGRIMLEALGNEYIFHYAPNAHVAINPQYKKHEPQLFSCFIEDTLDAIHLSDHDKHVITMNSIDSLTATIPSSDWINRIPQNKEVLIVIDDSHGIGILGEQGRGLYADINTLYDRVVLIASLGKAMGLPAGLVAGPVEYTALIKKHALFGGSSPMIPAYAHAYLHADNIYLDSLHLLQSNIRYFKEGLRNNTLFTYADGFPAFCTERHELYDYLDQHHIRISHFAYPSPKDRLYTRIVISALHTKDDLGKLINLLDKF